jgi:Rod binding domain-containing protein
MDVNKTIGAPATLNAGRKIAADHSWNATLNHASGIRAKSDLSSRHGVTKAATLENAKVSDLPAVSARAAFARVLDQATDRRKPLEPEEMAKLEQSSATLVNQFFMGSMLKQMRQSPFKVDSLNGGKGGEAYAGLFDQHIAEHAGNRIAKSLVNSMVKQYARTVAPSTGVAS